jgi:hypothetical protein
MHPVIGPVEIARYRSAPLLFYLMKVYGKTYK